MSGLARYTGSKTNASKIVNAALGRVRRWYEPFGGMLSLYLAYPHDPVEVVLGDINGHAVNLWRAVAYGRFEDFEPHTLAPWSHIDLAAWADRLREGAEGLKAKLRADPKAFDMEVAGGSEGVRHGSGRPVLVVVPRAARSGYEG